MDWKADDSEQIEVEEEWKLLFDLQFCGAFLLGENLPAEGWCMCGLAKE